jgi:hypothetical protein
MVVNGVVAFWPNFLSEYNLITMFCNSKNVLISKNFLNWFFEFQGNMDKCNILGSWEAYHIIIISIDVVIHLHISFLLLMLWFFYSFTIVLRLLLLCPRMPFFLQVRSPFFSQIRISNFFFEIIMHEFDVLLSDCHLCLVYVKRCEKLLLL